MYISSNYLIVSGEHRVHYNTNVCSRFCCTPRPFQAYGYPSLLPYVGGFGFHPRQTPRVCAYAAVYLGLLVLWHDSIGSLFSPHTRLLLWKYTPHTPVVRGYIFRKKWSTFFTKLYPPYPPILHTPNLEYISYPYSSSFIS